MCARWSSGIPRAAGERVTRAARQIAAAARPPRPRRTRTITPHTLRTPTVVQLAIAADAATACAAVVTAWRWDSSASVLVVPDTTSRAAFDPQAQLLRAIATCLQPAPVGVGLPVWTGARQERLWRDVGGDRVTRLGRRGWDRVELRQCISGVAQVDIAGEAIDSGTVVLPVVVASTPHVTTAALRVVHDSTVVRSASGAESIARLLAAVDATYIVVAPVAVGWLGAVTDDRIAAELLGQAIYQIAERERGVEARSPWEDEVVQRLSELRLGVVLPSQLVIRAVVSDNAARYVTWLTELIGCRLESSAIGGPGG
jgi:hypothetical protein